MKKVFLMVVMAIMTMTATAQTEEGFRMGIRVNAGLSNVLGEGDKWGFGYGVGWIAEYNFNSNLFIESGIGLENIGHKEDAIDGTLNGVFGQLPIHLGYRFPVGENASMFVQAGPTIACGLFGSSIDGDKYFDYLKRFDVGVGGRIGVEFNKYKISLGTNYGLLDATDGGGYHNFSLNLGFAYMF